MWRDNYSYRSIILNNYKRFPGFYLCKKSGGFPLVKHRNRHNVFKYTRHIHS